MQPESLVLLVLLAGMLLLLVNRTRRQQRAAQDLQSRITVGSRIMTTAGLHATVVEISDTVVTLETAPGQQSRWDRRAVARLLPDDAPAEESAAEETAGTTADVEPGVPAVTTADAKGETTEGDPAPPDRA